MSTSAPPLVRPSRTWEVLCHVAALSAYIGVPLGNVFGPLIVWLMKKAESSEVDEHGREALNFQISVCIYLAILAVLGFFTFLGTMVPLLGLLGVPVMFLLGMAGIALGIANVVLIIVAAVKASNGESFRYPLNLRLIR
jgi:uncharacterized protein